MSAPLSPALRAKLAPLLRMQASDNAGERANASAAIGRLLKAAGRDWHDLADMLLTTESAQSPPPPPRGTTSWKRTEGPAELPRDQLLELLNLIEQRTPFLSLKSREFVTSLRDRSRWRPCIKLSEKQNAWLQDLIEATGV